MLSARWVAAACLLLGMVPGSLLAQAWLPTPSTSVMNAATTAFPRYGIDPAPAWPGGSELLARPAAEPGQANSQRDSLVALAMKLRAVRYVRGGNNPATGFDCSGFVRYVFARALGLQLPVTSASQFRAGRQVARSELMPGDLVFFHTRGRQRVSHVGIYLDDGRFIHSPSAGKTVQVSSMGETYWSRRFVGARRPRGMDNRG